MVARWLALGFALTLIGGSACSESSEGTSPEDVGVEADAAGLDASDTTGETGAPDTTGETDAALDAEVDEGADPDATEAGETAEDAGDAVLLDGGDGDADDATDGDADDAGSDGDADTDDASSDGDAGPLTIAQMCFPDFADTDEPAPDYDQYDPVVGSHCVGSNHQDIAGVERVVFLGDSVTVGTPNDVHPLSIDNSHFYRNLLAEWLASTFALDKADALTWGFWKSYDYVSGKGGAKQAGDFWNCSKWGARTDDFIAGGGQIPECFPDGGSTDKTLVVFTMGGNDISAITQLGGEASDEEVAAGYPAAWALAQSTVDYLEEAVMWLKDPVNFPNGSYVVFANPFEFTDGTGQVDACTPETINIPGVGEISIGDLGFSLAGLAGLKEWAQPQVQAEIVVWILEEYMRIAVEYQADLIWLLESFCGHGYVATGADADPDNRCYLGPDAELYFDITCIHPSDAGHAALAELFEKVIAE